MPSALPSLSEVHAAPPCRPPLPRGAHHVRRSRSRVKRSIIYIFFATSSPSASRLLSAAGKAHLLPGHRPRSMRHPRHSSASQGAWGFGGLSTWRMPSHAPAAREAVSPSTPHTTYPRAGEPRITSQGTFRPSAPRGRAIPCHASRQPAPPPRPVSSRQPASIEPPGYRRAPCHTFRQSAPSRQAPLVFALSIRHKLHSPRERGYISHPAPFPHDSTCLPFSTFCITPQHTSSQADTQPRTSSRQTLPPLMTTPSPLSWHGDEAIDRATMLLDNCLASTSTRRKRQEESCNTRLTSLPHQQADEDASTILAYANSYTHPLPATMAAGIAFKARFMRNSTASRFRPNSTPISRQWTTTPYNIPPGDAAPHEHDRQHHSREQAEEWRIQNHSTTATNMTHNTHAQGTSMLHPPQHENEDAPRHPHRQCFIEDGGETMPHALSHGNHINAPPASHPHASVHEDMRDSRRQEDECMDDAMRRTSLCVSVFIQLSLPSHDTQMRPLIPSWHASKRQRTREGLLLFTTPTRGRGYVTMPQHADPFHSQQRAMPTILALLFIRT